MASQKQKVDSVQWHRQIKYQCRRGMLELDTILQRAFTQRFPAFSAEDQQLFAELLEQEDTTLLLWLTGREIPENKELARLIELIR